MAVLWFQVRPEPKGAGLWWCKKEDYPALKKLFKDGDTFPPTWEGWLKEFETFERQHTQRGKTLVRINLEPRAFASWCKNHKLAPDQRARLQFAAEGYRKKVGKKR